MEARQAMNRIDLEGRAVVITGGARGIGYAVAQRALNSGASVALWDVDAERLERSQRELAE
jgi:NAD(P)-dependent dehydrogenase (short-subunit alcohol dehydrogenase family)